MVIAIVKERLKALRRTKLYDLLAATPIIAWFAFSMSQMLPPLAQRAELVMVFIRTDPSVLPATLVVRTLSEAATLVFFALSIVMYMVRTVPQRGALGFYPRLLLWSAPFPAWASCCCRRKSLSYALYIASLLLIIAGIGFAICAVLVLGRSISLLPEARQLVTWGPYALVRHPLYLGEMVAVAGVALQYLSAWALLLLALVCVVQLQRMKYEERVLSRSFPEYGDYMARTARLVPGVY